MMYNEFLERTTREISSKDYSEYIEPVYNYIEGMDKDLCGEMYTKMGLNVFKALKPYAKEIQKLTYEILKTQHKLQGLQEKYKEIKA